MAGVVTDPAGHPPPDDPAPGPATQPADGAPVSGPSEHAPNWHQLLQVIHGVLLSAALGAFATVGIPQVLARVRRPDGRIELVDGADIPTEATATWMVIAAASIVVAFDAWYQYSLHGPAMPIEGRRRGYKMIALLSAMVWTSFMPFLFIVRTIPPDDYGRFLSHEPVLRIFAFSILVTLIVEMFFIVIISRPTPGHTDLDDKRMIVIFFRLLCVVALVMFVGVSESEPEVDSFARVLALVGIWASFRLVETLASYLIDRRDASAARAVTA